MSTYAYVRNIKEKIIVQTWSGPVDIIFKTEKEAEKVATLLNKAFEWGRKDLAADLRTLIGAAAEDES